MTSDSKPLPASTGLAADPTHQEVRLRLKPQAAAPGLLDGAWWPRSTGPVAEFPALLAGIGVRMGTVDRMAFNVTAWARAPRHLVVDGRPILLEGFRTVDPHMVFLSGHGWHRMALLVIPPDTAADVAGLALVRASDPANTERAAQILAAAGGRDDAERRWEGDGGRVYERD